MNNQCGKLLGELFGLLSVSVCERFGYARIKVLILFEINIIMSFMISIIIIISTLLLSHWSYVGIYLQAAGHN